MTRPDSSRTTVLLLVAVVLLALGIRGLFLVQLRDSAQYDFQLTHILDTHTFDLWAKDIVRGDWLGKSPPHPYHEWWQGPIGSEEKWIEWFGGEAVYHQAPLYPYLMAIVYAVAPDGRLAVLVIQLLLGALHAGLVFLLARRFAGLGAATAAGVAAALYGPLILYEGTLLRDAMLTHLSTLTVYATVRTLDDGSRRWGVAAGLACGAAILARPVALLLALSLCVLLGLRSRRAVPAFLAGVLLALLPFAARNMAFGISPLKLTTRGPVAFITGNAADGPGVGWEPPPSTRPILERTEYHLVPTALETLKTHRDRPLGFFALQWKKAAAYVGGDEIANNINFYHVRRVVPVLRAPPSITWTPIAALGLAGMVLAWRRRLELAPAFLLFACHTAGTLGFFVISRFRQPIVPVLILFGALWIDAVVGIVRRKEWTRLAVPTLLAAVALVAALPRLSPADRYDAGVFGAEVLHWTQRNDLPRALEAADAAASVFTDHVDTQILAGKVRLVAGQIAEASAAFDRAANLDPDNVDACVGLGEALAARGGIEEGLRQLRSCGALPAAAEHADLAYALGIAHLRTGNTDEAREAFRRALALRPGDGRAPLARRVLETESGEP